MRNLAGDEFAEASIRDELAAIGADLVPIATNYRGEVPAKSEGRLGPFVFRRAWYYWTVQGRVPQAIAEAMYADPIGRKDVRVHGYAGNTPPTGDVCSYHIDSAAGLRLFVDTMRRHCLDRADALTTNDHDD